MNEHIHTQPYIEMRPEITRTLDAVGTFFDTLKWAVYFSRLCQDELLLHGHIAPRAMERIAREVNCEA